MKGIRLSTESILNISDKIGKPCYEYLRNEIKKELLLQGKKDDKVNSRDFIVLLFSLMSLLNANIFIWLVEFLNHLNYPDESHFMDRELVENLKEDFLKNLTEVIEYSIKVEFDEKYQKA